MNLSLLPAAHLLLPLFHSTNEGIGWKKFVGKDGRGQQVMGKPDLGRINSLPAKGRGAVRKKERKKIAPAHLPQAQLNSLSPGLYILPARRHRVNVIVRDVTSCAKRII